jgi:hypothetical protein
LPSSDIVNTYLTAQQMIGDVKAYNNLTVWYVWVQIASTIFVVFLAAASMGAMLFEMWSKESSAASCRSTLKQSKVRADMTVVNSR